MPRVAILSILIIFILFFILFLGRGLLFLDPDFGWHFKMGELIVDQGIPATDPFSYTMSNFPFVDHEWLTNIFFFYIYSNLGMVVLACLFAILSTFALFNMIPRPEIRFSLVPLILSSTVLSQFAGVRPQVITWVLFTIVLNLTLNEHKWLKYRLILPLIFILWANLHGAFALGIVITSFFVFIRIITHKRIDLTDILVAMLSALSTLINPYGIHLWGEVWMQLSDSSLRFAIVEWQPSFFIFNLSYLILLVISCFFIVRYKNKFSLYEKGLFVILLIAGISSLRHIPLWLFITLNLSTRGFYFFYQEVIKNKEVLRRAILVYRFLIFFVIIASFISLNFYINVVLDPSPYKSYPVEAIKFLKTKQYEGNLFANYNFGGFLIWQYGEKKVFVDGRMPSWRWKSPDESQSDWAFQEYRDAILEKRDYREVFAKYNIEYVLWNAPDKEENGNNTESEEKVGFFKLFDDFVIQVFNIHQPKKGFFEHLREDGWKEVYRDNVSIIFKK